MRPLLASARRRRAVLAVLLTAILAGGRLAAADWPGPEPRVLDPRVIVAFGDSITLGVLADAPLAERPYPAGVQIQLDSLRPGFTVLNHGVGGETTDFGLARLPGVLAAQRPAIVLIMEGTNDATFEFDPAFIVANLRQMVQLAKASAAIPILGAIPPNFRPFAPEARAILAAVNAQLPALALEEGIRFVDTFSALNDEGLFGSDQLHPTQVGYDVLAAAWLPAVVAAIDAAAPGGGVVDRASVDSAGGQAVFPPGGGAFRPAISADRRHVAFWSHAANLVPGDTNGVPDVFVHDRQTGATTRASVATGGVEATGTSGGDVAISADGRLVAFTSDAVDLVPGDTNGTRDVFLHDRQTGETTRVSVGTGGIQATGGTVGSTEVALSADGRFVAFTSDHPSLAGGPVRSRVFVHDRLMNTTTHVSVAMGGADPNAESAGPSLRADGFAVVFASRATNLSPLATAPAGPWRVYLRNLQTGNTGIVSISFDGSVLTQSSGRVSAGEPADRPVISGDGRFAAFASAASNLVSGDTNGLIDVFVWDLQVGGTSRVSVASGGAQAAGSPDAEGSWLPAISADGRLVAFTSLATNLVPLDSNGVRDIFVHDRAVPGGITTRVSLARDGREGSLDSFRPSLSADGRVIVFESFAADLVPGDTNGGTAGRDVFVALLRSFVDVPMEHFAWPSIEALVASGVTAGCMTSPPAFCPESPVARDQMAVFLLKAGDPGFVPPGCTVPPFADVPCSSIFAPWVAELADRGITTGCGGGNYCPASPVTREQMAVLLLRTEDPGLVPPGCVTPPFADVSCGSVYAPWIQELVVRGVTAGCSVTLYCPADLVTRAQMAIFLVRTFGLIP